MMFVVAEQDGILSNGKIILYLDFFAFYFTTRWYYNIFVITLGLIIKYLAKKTPATKSGAYLMLGTYLSNYLQEMGNKNNTEQNELLLSAVKKNKVAAAKEAINKGADVSFKDKKGASVLMWAAYKTDLDFVKYLIDNGADYHQKGIIDDGNGGFYGNLTGIATIKGDLEMLQYFIEELKIDIDDLEQQMNDNPGWSALQWAISKDKIDIIKYLLKTGANPNPIYAKQTSLHGAIRNQNIEVFELLVEAGAVIKNDKFITLLAEACRNEKQIFIKRLLELGADPNDLNHGAPALLYAVGYGNLERCKLLIFNGANPHFADKYGNTALTLAKRMDHQAIVEYLKTL